MSGKMSYSDFDYERRYAEVQRLERAVQHLNQATVRGMAAMKEISSAFEAVGAVLVEMTAVNVGASHRGSYPGPAQHAPHDDDAQWESVSQIGSVPGSAIMTHISDDRMLQMHHLASAFAEEAQEINEGAPFREYNTGVHRDVVNRLLPVMEHLKAVEGVARKRDETLTKYLKYKASVDKEEKKCAKKGKPFIDQSQHKKYTEKRDASWKDYQATRSRFFESYATLMEVNGHAASHLVHRYLTLNGQYLRTVLAAIDRILPEMEAIYPMNAEFGSLAPSIVTAAAAYGKRHEKSPQNSTSDSADTLPSASELKQTQQQQQCEQQKQQPKKHPSPFRDDGVRPVCATEDYAYTANQWKRFSPGVGGNRGDMTDRAALPGAAEDFQNGSEHGMSRHPAFLITSIETAPAREFGHGNTDLIETQSSITAAVASSSHVWRAGERTTDEASGASAMERNELHCDPLVGNGVTKSR